MNKEAEKLLEEAIAYKGDYAYGFMCKKINQALLKEQPESKCKTCGGSGKIPRKEKQHCRLRLCTDMSIPSCFRCQFYIHEKPCPDCTAPEQPNCEGCEFFKHTNKFHHCYRYTEEPSLCKLRQPIEQPPASGDWQGGGKEPERQEWDRNKEQPPAGDVFEIRIPNLKPDEVEIVRIEINAFTKQLLNNLQARRRTN